MPAPQAGWYPDPGGAPDRYRYWDGSGWSSGTTGDPRLPPPVRGGPESQPPRRRWSVLVGVLTLVVIGGVIAALILFGARDPVAPNPPTSTLAGGDDASPTSDPASPSDLSSPSDPTGTALVDCPDGDPNLRAVHPIDDRVYGGNLSFPEQVSFDRATVEPRFSFAYDVVQQTRRSNQTPPWIAQLAVGRLRGGPGFGGTARQAVEMLVQCSLTGGIYNAYRPTRRDLRSEAVTIDGRSGWLLETDVLVAEPGLPFPGDHAVFLVVEDGPHWGFFFGGVPIGNQDLDIVLADTVRNLRAS